jgi:hypothetical protein
VPTPSNRAPFPGRALPDEISDIKRRLHALESGGKSSYVVRGTLGGERIRVGWQTDGSISIRWWDSSGTQIRDLPA